MTEIPADVCRICLCSGLSLQPIVDLLSSLRNCFPAFQWVEGDDLPQGICGLCTEELGVVVNFKRKLDLADSQFRSMFGSKRDSAVILSVKVEPSVVEDTEESKEDVNFEISGQADDEEDEEETPLEQVSRSNSCENCDRGFGTRQEKEEHRRKDQCFSPLMCNICKLNVKTKKSLRRHYQSATHLTRSISISQKGGAKLKEEEELDVKYQDIPTPTDLTCPVCRKKCNTKAAFKRHYESHGPKKYCCTTCNREFKRADQLKVHAHLHDKDLPRFECDICGKSYYLKSILREHIRVHTKESLALCSFCGKSFTSKSNLKQHVLRHTNTKQFECTEPGCGKKFVSKGELKGHLRIHTGDHPYVCDVCGLKFTMSYSLKKHKRTHTGERPYTCSFCQKSFKILETLKIHRRIHTGEKPFVCSFCSRAFTQKNDMIKHERIHTGERLYGCNICGKRFVQASTLNTHIKGVHKGQTVPPHPPPESMDTKTAPPPASSEPLDVKSHGDIIQILPSSVVTTHTMFPVVEYQTAVVLNE